MDFEDHMMKMSKEEKLKEFKRLNELENRRYKEAIRLVGPRPSTTDDYEEASDYLKKREAFKKEWGQLTTEEKEKRKTRYRKLFGKE